MSVEWHGAVAFLGKSTEAGLWYHDQGVDTRVPKVFTPTLSAKGARILSCKPRIDPYLFIRYDAGDNEQDAFVRKCRFLDFILMEANVSRENARPAIIDPADIWRFDHMEFIEANGLKTTSKNKSGRTDLELNAKYRIRNHPVFAGQTGTLVAAFRGQASIRLDHMLITLPDRDIEPAATVMKMAVGR